MKEVINVQGMSCNHCVQTIEKNVGAVTGVSTVKVDLDQGKVELEFDDNATSLQAIADVIEDQGFDVVE